MQYHEQNVNMVGQSPVLMHCKNTRQVCPTAEQPAAPVAARLATCTAPHLGVDTVPDWACTIICEHELLELDQAHLQHGHEEEFTALANTRSMPAGLRQTTLSYCAAQCKSPLGT